MSNGSTDYDLIVIGAGPVGENVADYARKRGIRVAIVESELVGGECSYWACMPSKALLRSGHALRAVERLDGARQAETGRLDVSAVLARRDAFASDWKDDDQVAWLESAGIDLLRGHGRIAGPGVVDVDGRSYTAAAVAVATGSIPVLPDVPGSVRGEAVEYPRGHERAEPFRPAWSSSAEVSRARNWPPHGRRSARRVALVARRRCSPRRSPSPVNSSPKRSGSSAWMCGSA